MRPLPRATKLRTRAPAKINLCLFLGPVRADGRHALVTVIEPLTLADEVTLETAESGPDTVMCPGVEGPNLASAALSALRAAGWEGPPVRVVIDKRIPVAAGMGGGSSDAAATLRLAAELAPVPSGIAEALGSDVPALLDARPVLASSAGEALRALAPLAPHAFAIVPQPFGLSTAEVYAEADRLALPRSADQLSSWRRRLGAVLRPGARLPASLLVNDLLPAALSLAPQVGEALDLVRADDRLLCGSGPTVAGLFWGPDAADRAAAAAASLAGRYPASVAASPLPGGAGPHLRGGAQSAGVP